VKLSLDIASLSKLKGQGFETPNEEWTRSILICRKEGKNRKLFHKLDYVYGPLADGKVRL
jgi:hypothetical protein